MTASPRIPRRWHLYWVDLGSRGKARPGKVRPCLVVQPTWDDISLSTTVVLPLTTSLMPPGSFPLRVRVPAGTCGLRSESDVMVEQVFAWPNRAFRDDLGAVPQSVRDAVRMALVDFLDLEEE